MCAAGLHHIEFAQGVLLGLSSVGPPPWTRSGRNAGHRTRYLLTQQTPSKNVCAYFRLLTLTTKLGVLEESHLSAVYRAE